MNEEEAELELVMPFVVCPDPYEDDAFVAGFTAGQIDRTLSMLASVVGVVSWSVPTGLVPQLDLIAMRHGFKMTSEPWEAHPDEWTFASFERFVE